LLMLWFLCHIPLSFPLHIMVPLSDINQPLHSISSIIHVTNILHENPLSSRLYIEWTLIMNMSCITQLLPHFTHGVDTLNIFN
jgi:hypothetical protein